MKLHLVSRRAWMRLGILGVVLALLAVYGWCVMIRMPGKSHAGPLPPADAATLALEEALRKDVETLGGEIGHRNVPDHRNLAAAADFLEASLARAGYKVQRQEYVVEGQSCRNLEVELHGGGKAEEIVVVGAHYDSVIGSPGANDNGSGVAAVLALARAFYEKPSSRTLRFVTFVNEEPPYFQTDRMGSVVYAKRCRQRGEKVVAMLSLETIGYYSDEKNSQHYPPPFSLFYPSTGNFIAFVGNTASKALVRETVASFRRHAQFPSEGAAIWEGVTGIGWSDHWSFWQEGYPALMVTDTAPFRYPYYHSTEDTPDKIDYNRMARVVAGLEKVIAELVGPPPQ